MMRLDGKKGGAKEISGQRVSELNICAQGSSKSTERG